MAVEVLLMRHGETEANVNEVLVGREDSPFTPAGRNHPLEVARHLEVHSFTAVYSSPMKRAQRTADLVLEALDRDVPLTTETALAEIDAGEYTGLTFEQVRARVRRRNVDLDEFGSFRYPGGESWLDVQARAVEFVSSLDGPHASEAVLIVTHAGVIAGLAAHVAGEAIEEHIRRRYFHDFLGRAMVEDGTIADFDRIAGTIDSWL